MNIRSCTQALEGSLLPSVTRAHIQLSLESRMEDKTFVGQHKRKHEFPVVTQISHRNSRKTKWFRSHSKMRPLPAGAPQEKSNFPFSIAKRYLERFMRPQKLPDIPVSLEGNTEVPSSTSSEPLLPS